MTESKNALDLFRTAYEHRYTWDANFPGYQKIGFKTPKFYLGFILGCPLTPDCATITSKKVNKKQWN